MPETTNEIPEQTFSQLTGQFSCPAVFNHDLVKRYFIDTIKISLFRFLVKLPKSFFCLYSLFYWIFTIIKLMFCTLLLRVSFHEIW